MEKLSRRAAHLAPAIVLLAMCASVLSQEALTPRQSRRLSATREKLAEALDKLKAAGVCPTCSGTGVTAAPTPEARVRRGEAPTRDVLCPTCLGTGVSGVQKLRTVMARAITRVRSSYGDAIGRAAARDAMKKIFHAQAVLLQDKLFEKVREELQRDGLWTLDARERAVGAGVQPMRIDIAVAMKRLARDLDLYARRRPMPIVFEQGADGEIILENGKTLPREKSVLPKDVRFEIFSLGEVGRTASRFRETVVGALMRRYSFVSKEAPASQPAAHEGTGEAPTR